MRANNCLLQLLLVYSLKFVPFMTNSVYSIFPCESDFALCTDDHSHVLLLLMHPTLRVTENIFTTCGHKHC